MPTTTSLGVLAIERPIVLRVRESPADAPPSPVIVQYDRRCCALLCVSLCLAVGVLTWYAVVGA